MSTQSLPLQAQQPENQNSLAIIPGETGIGFQSAAAFELLQRVGKMYSACPMVPDTYKGNVSACSIAVLQAHRMGADPLMVMQNLYLVHNHPGWSAKFLTATFNAGNEFSKIRYEWKGNEFADDWGCRAFAAERATGEVLHGPWVTWKIVKEEGWLAKNGSKWKTMPELMFMYRAASWFINTHCPEIAMGLRTAEEIEDTENSRDAKNVTEAGETIEKVANIPPSANVPVDPANFEKKTELPAADQGAKSKPTTASKKTQPPASTTQAGSAYSDKEPEPPAGIGIPVDDPFQGGSPNFGN